MVWIPGQREPVQCLKHRVRADQTEAARAGSDITHMALPCRACGTPSRRSEYQHPDADICWTQPAYRQHGLTA